MILWFKINQAWNKAIIESAQILSSIRWLKKIVLKLMSNFFLNLCLNQSCQGLVPGVSPIPVELTECDEYFSSSSIASLSTYQLANSLQVKPFVEVSI